MKKKGGEVAALPLGVAGKRVFDCSSNMGTYLHAAHIFSCQVCVNLGKDLDGIFYSYFSRDITRECM
jgi:hypothetical protein